MRQKEEAGGEGRKEGRRRKERERERDLQGSNGETDTENRLMDMGRGEERVRCMERITWKLTSSYGKQTANANLLLCLTELKQGLCINLDGWDGEGDGREAQKGVNICTTLADSC